MYVSLQFRRDLWLGDLDWRVFRKWMDAKVIRVNEIVKVKGKDGSCVLFFMGFKGGYKDVKHNPLPEFQVIGKIND